MLIRDDVHDWAALVRDALAKAGVARAEKILAMVGKTRYVGPVPDLAKMSELMTQLVSKADSSEDFAYILNPRVRTPETLFDLAEKLWNTGVANGHDMDILEAAEYLASAAEQYDKTLKRH